MTKQELRMHPEYKVCMERIKGYRPGFEFTVRFCDIPTQAKVNGMRFILKDAVEAGLIESIATDLGWSQQGLWMGVTAETFRRCAK